MNNNPAGLGYMFWVLVLLLILPVGAVFINMGGNTVPVRANGRVRSALSARPDRNPVVLPGETAETLKTTVPSGPAENISNNPDPIQVPAEEPTFAKGCIKAIRFYGSAKPHSKVEGANLVLIAKDSPAWAYARLDFEEELNLWNDSIIFFARCLEGREILKVGMTDNTSRTTPKNDSSFIELTPDWQKIVIDRSKVRTSGIDESRVVSIEFIITAASGRQKEKSEIHIKDFDIL